ncbi:MAG: hypothetical protein KY468_14975 [Armatimonadetes bacterium]|nr:hypothetical protein [Armatimonadota bacterium]
MRFPNNKSMELVRRGRWIRHVPGEAIKIDPSFLANFLPDEISLSRQAESERIGIRAGFNIKVFLISGGKWASQAAGAPFGVSHL